MGGRRLPAGGRRPIAETRNNAHQPPKSVIASQCAHWRGNPFPLPFKKTLRTLLWLRISRRVFALYIIWVRLEQVDKYVDYPSDSKQTASKQIQYSHSCFSVIEFMGTYHSQEQTQEERNPLVPASSVLPSAISIHIDVCIRVRIAVIDYDVGLGGTFQLFHLLSALWTNHTIKINALPTVLTEFLIGQACPAFGTGSRAVRYLLAAGLTEHLFPSISWISNYIIARIWAIVNMKAILYAKFIIDKAVQSMIRYDRLWETMKRRGITQYRLIKEHQFSTGQLDRLRKNENLSTHTLNELCRILDCGLEDIAEYTPDDS